MQLEMSFKNIEAPDRLKEFVHEKMDRLTKFFDGRIHARWTFSIDHQAFVAHVHVTGNHLDYFVEADADDNFFTVTERAVDKLERQLQRKKEQLKDHHKA